MRLTGLQIVSLVILPSTIASGIRSGNRALNKPANQSSMYSTMFNNQLCEGRAEYAVDGSAEDSFYKNSCSHTNESHGGFFGFIPGSVSSWWEVDLEEQVNIHNIRILNRDINCERLHDVRVDVFETMTLPRKRKPCTTYKGPAKRGWVNLTCDDPVSGRVVRLTKPYRDQYDVLTLCEVEVYGPKADGTDGADVTVADAVADGSGSILTREEASGLSYRNCCSVCG